MALISYRKNSYTRGWYIKFLNLSIIEYRINFEKQKGIFHVFGLPLFFTNVKVKTVEKYADAVFRFFPNHDLYVCCYSGAGEVYQLALRLQKYVNDSCKKNPCIICTNKKLEQVFRMAIRDNIPIYVLHDLRCQFIDTSFERNGKTIFVPLNRIYFTAVEQKILSGNSHYFDCLLSHLGKLSKEKSAVSRSVSGTVKEIRKKYPKIAFLSPEADTLKELPFEYWHSIVIFLKSEGYQVFLNAMNSKYDLLDVTQTKELSYQEAVELCSQSDLLLGMRSGFVELALFNGAPKAIVIYNNFRDTCVTKLTAKQALNGFTLKKMPICNSSNVTEVLFEDYDDPYSLFSLVANK